MTRLLMNPLRDPRRTDLVITRAGAACRLFPDGSMRRLGAEPHDIVPPVAPGHGLDPDALLAFLKLLAMQRRWRTTV